MIEDIIHCLHKKFPFASDRYIHTQVSNMALIEIDDILGNQNKSLNEYAGMPMSSMDLMSDGDNPLILTEQL